MMGCPICGLNYHNCKGHPGYEEITSVGSERAIELAVRFGGIDGDHHKAWVIDQMVRALAGDKYDAIVKEACGDGEYTWDVGIAP